MSRIPKDPSFDNSLALLSEGYAFIPPVAAASDQTCSRRG
jgi:hypothetical protein